MTPVEPGPHKVKMIWGGGFKDGPESAITAEGGKLRFLHLSLRSQNMGTKDQVTWLILELPLEQALPLLEPCKHKPLSTAQSKPP